MVDNRINGESGGRMDLQFPCNVAAVRNHRVHRDAELVGNFFIAQAFHDTNNDFSFAVSFSSAGIVGLSILAMFNETPC